MLLNLAPDKFLFHFEGVSSPYAVLVGKLFGPTTGRRVVMTSPTGLTKLKIILTLGSFDREAK